MTISICKKCGRSYDSESFNNRVWHKEPWGCEEHEPNRGDEPKMKDRDRYCEKCGVTPHEQTGDAQGYYEFSCKKCFKVHYVWNGKKNLEDKEC